ncbi:phosphatidylinositol N-acetylglucosaminyltransferase subunit A isoform X2 [Hyalella azteca]|uniref:Phosphatidylinositol N-acetylglucosaminyltransferase subunit A isoform X2 n=1 Tax=Hyalella azteca TaxID=294128 RepID=A0A979FJE7_HYAAZ|nr:phosphatidylinositol N-acetylglucosaminyltransferase subunit A isoform X2 [Hyalella azteca]
MVYYLPIQPFYNQSVLPTFLTSVPLLRDVLLREGVDVVHGHSAFSTMAHEAMSVASALGIKTVFTDHSLFGFADVSAIVTNNFLTMSLACVDRCICVSYVGKENTVLRASVPPQRVSVIPNALDTNAFHPRPYTGPRDRVVVVVMCRLQYRKGVDLQPPIIRHICARYPNVDFVIGGGGPKMGLLSEVRDEVGPERVTLLGPVAHADVPQVLARGHVFLNTSLTEAFCIAICEAVAAGLQVVSTDVGGITEVLPPSLICLAQPNVKSLCNALEGAIEREMAGTRMSPEEQHRLMRGLYSWPDVALRTERVYCSAMWDEQQPRPLLRNRINRYMEQGGLLAGGFMVLLVTLQALILALCDIFRPSNNIDKAPDFPVPATLSSKLVKTNASSRAIPPPTNEKRQAMKDNFRGVQCNADISNSGHEFEIIVNSRAKKFIGEKSHDSQALSRAVRLLDNANLCKKSVNTNASLKTDRKALDNEHKFKYNLRRRKNDCDY